ncbi:sigma 54-interacting transcriptional regulator [Clostridium saccharoperbutylacetonicum]|uniref:sigma 54-interacting transcriptional regulator n=1 Tax=Clostridium saccharoperbutylacetonicum TaxID=36745 RepID=UPI00098407AD|nr:sigma-54-dependent transcriptional regulator [Clostridium saccharoperbutylacetonicum]AQR97991.1 regulatory protein LuxO [Clostridium saccharoperbutylacetonicum]NSB33884.1 transcriptional regulatory protein LevR/transcriptional regulator with AAA-type ATPase domain [Clostridium saccharoperbutylacetonicum]
MKRIERIYSYIETNSKNFTKNKLLEIKGFSAQEIGEKLDILRSNVSRELNTLCRDRKIIKIKNRPVLYFDRSSFEEILSIKLPKELEEISDFEEFVKVDKSIGGEEESPFNYLIGAHTSLKNQIEQAKAALLYPPNGLHTLIIGSTGVGKSLFVNIMYQYSKYIKKLQEDAPFVVFNCADYSNNPQLLLSYIFGHVKGAFTGADKEKEGIVEKADGGILFLDEIHRLPPEGQEMIFYFMDTGTYNKLGETDRHRKANVLLIGATTEDPSSALLNTFIRRIPITILIPNFEERSMEDKLELIHYLLSKEAQRVNKTIRISVESIKALIGSTSYGNVGQLKSNIQLICATGFLNCMNTDKDIDINLNSLPTNIRDGLLNFENKSKDDGQVWNRIPKLLTIKPDGNRTFIETDGYEPPFNIYNIIEDKAFVLKEEGMSDQDIKKYITTDINVHLKQFYAKFKGDTHRKDGLLKIVDKDIVDFAQEIKALAEDRLDKSLNDRFIYAISLHFSALFNRIKKNTVSFSNNIKLTLSTINTKEYEVAKEIHKLIEDRYDIAIPEIEIEYLALLLNSIQELSHQERVGIVVAAHGTSTATSMVAVAKKLFEADNILAVDMPLERTPSDILESIIDKVKQIDEGKGVLLLVDMGSLNTFGETITERTNINVKSIDMVSTALVLEAVRKCSLTDTDLDSVYSYLLTDFRGYTNNINAENDLGDDNVIVTICSTGKGAAVKLKELVEAVTKNISISSNVKVIPTGIINLNESIKHISEKHKILALVGITNPNLGIPFISIEELINGAGENVLRNIIEGKLTVSSARGEDQIVLKNLCKQTLMEIVTFINPEKIYPLLDRFVKAIEAYLEVQYDNPTKLRIIFHVACALERMLLNNGLVYDSSESELNPQYVQALREANLIFKEALSISLTDDEIYYIVDAINVC